MNNIDNEKRFNELLQTDLPRFWDSVENRIKLFKAQQPEKVEIFDCDYETGVKIAEELNYEQHQDCSIINKE